MQLCPGAVETDDQEIDRERLIPRAQPGCHSFSSRRPKTSIGGGLWQQPRLPDGSRARNCDSSWRPCAFRCCSHTIFHCESHGDEAAFPSVASIVTRPAESQCANAHFRVLCAKNLRDGKERGGWQNVQWARYVLSNRHW